MSLATREQKAVVTDFCACRALWFFHAMKERIRIRLNKELPINSTENFTARQSSIGCCTSVTGANHLLGDTQNLLSLAKNASRLLLMRSSLMPLQQATARCKSYLTVLACYTVISPAKSHSISLRTSSVGRPFPSRYISLVRAASTVLSWPLTTPASIS